MASFTDPTTYCIGKSENFLQDLSSWVWRSGLLYAQYVSWRKGVWGVPDQDTRMFPQFPGHERNTVPFSGGACDGFPVRCHLLSDSASVYGGLHERTEQVAFILEDMCRSRFLHELKWLNP